MSRPDAPPVRGGSGSGIAARVSGLTVLALAPVLAILWLAAASERRQAVADARERLTREARSVALRYTDAAEDLTSVLSAYSLVPEFRRMSSTACALLEGVGDLNPGYRSLALVRSDGTFACQTLPGGGSTSVSDRAWFSVPMELGRTTTQVIGRGRISGVPMLVVGYPVRDGAGQLVGVLGAGFALDDVAGVRDELAIAPDRDLRLLGEDGVLARTREGPLALDSVEVAFLASGDTLGIVDHDRGGDRIIEALAASPGVNGLVAVIGASEATLLEAIERRFLLQLGALVLLAGVAVVLAALLCGRWVARPLVGVVRAARSVGAGDLDARAPAGEGPKEVRALADTFNAMAASLKDRELSLRETNQALRESSEKLAQAQKMEALGHLTGGVAHDFNNLLTVIGGNLQLAVEAGVHDPEGLIGQALNASESGAQVTSRLLAFARKQPLTATPVDLNELCRGIHDLVRRSIGDHIEVAYDLHDGSIPCTLDTSQMESVLLNLAVNARDAMPTGGVLTIRTAVRRIDDDGRLSEGVYGVVEVSDTGHGMTPDVAARAVEPFFTTKERGQGTGLGLSGALGFAEQSGGTLEIETAPGMGTRVRVLVRSE